MILSQRGVTPSPSGRGRAVTYTRNMFQTSLEQRADEVMETYVKRLEDLQGIAESFGGVEKSFAVQAGREVRILVRPEEFDDLSATRLARDIVKKIEDELTYPGQIKVTVIRETRAVEYAK